MKKILALLVLSSLPLFGNIPKKAKGTLIIDPLEEGIRSYGKIELKNKKNTYILTTDLFGKVDYEVYLKKDIEEYKVKICEGEEGNFTNYSAKEIQIREGYNDFITLEKKQQK